MRIDTRTAEYVLAVTRHLEADTLPRVEHEAVCVECAGSDEDNHLTWARGQRRVIIVGCEGFWCVPPARVGVEAPDWQAPADGRWLP